MTCHNLYYTTLKSLGSSLRAQRKASLPKCPKCLSTRLPVKSAVRSTARGREHRNSTRAYHILIVEAPPAASSRISSTYSSCMQAEALVAELRKSAAARCRSKSSTHPRPRRSAAPSSRAILLSTSGQSKTAPSTGRARRDKAAAMENESR